MPLNNFMETNYCICDKQRIWSSCF